MTTLIGFILICVIAWCILKMDAMHQDRFIKSLEMFRHESRD
jgi:hypothetical protein